MHTIIRVQKNRQNPYVMIRNALFEDPALSWKAKGLLGYVLSRPGDWHIHVRDLIHRSTDGRDSVYAALRELKVRGYVQETVQRHSHGFIVAREYVVFEEPQLDPENPDQVSTALDPGKPDQAVPDREKPDQVEPLKAYQGLELRAQKPDLLITDLSNTDKEQDLKDLQTPETDPSTSSKSQDLAAKPRDASVGVVPVASEPAPPEPPLASSDAQGARREDHDRSSETSDTVRTAESPSSSLCDPVSTEEQDGEVDLPKSDGPRSVSLSSTGRPLAPEAKQLADALKQRLQERGVTVFPRDWHLKAQASAQRLLATLSLAEAEALMEWALAHPFWGTKITDWYRIVALAPEWQQARHPGKGGSPHGPNRLPTSLTAGRHDDQGSLDALIQGP